MFVSVYLVKKERFSLMLHQVWGDVSTHRIAPDARFMRLERSAAGNLPAFPASGGRNGRHTVYKPQYRLQ
ncbi:hypothetical protein EWP20_02555 [Neisseria meningitidis]|nr:hypothetical protein [Neisseria meningitidis]MBG8593230.1 hypothetical protein [Neisseria meningitidis]MBG8603356.1 hypothetical protein [Neisseria meningitidis]MBG8605157.1 hypothetical protein [Neisseria meningitidis]MBG8609050.1 hypothetical protein [Neisseria meningitidis]